ncbi:N-acetylglucosamine-6-phosphate deacetylase [Bosea sp. PAMC 26642]|uniref:N-acetylglucosamine-6-phosphate deacetylase n=1 Tax=Bosea sp. (strain PAMC 26642) TaxID=1792307 RepID=UPI0007703F70|nr:amidohydrolase family protein [Bosea sp. PAMC 26642]AMJ63215.1 N-acetylglucosamine-6-phosphate deacetylase [Bosea sp. PAMC 26642]
MTISAGLVDLQVNGFAGIDFNSGTITPAEMDHALEAMLATGVTTCLPTIITAHPDELEARFLALDAAISGSRLGSAMCPGYHLEGPFLNPAPGHRGCHPPEAMTAADPALVARLQGLVSRPILMVTLAPEIDGALALTATLADQGVIVALGHSAADFAQVAAATDAGARLVTHLGNGMPQSMHKLENPIFAQLAEDRLQASFIADGIHLHPKALQSLLRAKGLARSILVTDAVAAAAAKPGRYRFAGMEIDRTPSGAVRLPGATSLAGSALCLDQAVRNLVAWGLATVEEALAMASRTPLALLASALAAYGLAEPESEVEWSADLAVRRIRIGPIERRYGLDMAVS